MDTDRDPRPDLTAAQRIAIALGTAELPPPGDVPVDPAAAPHDPSFPDPPARPGGVVVSPDPDVTAR